MWSIAIACLGSDYLRACILKMKNVVVVTTRLSHFHLFEIIATLLIYTPFLYFNWIKIYIRLITLDKYTILKKKIVSAVFEKIKKHEKIFM